MTQNGDLDIFELCLDVYTQLVNPKLSHDDFSSLSPSAWRNFSVPSQWSKCSPPLYIDLRLRLPEKYNSREISASFFTAILGCTRVSWSQSQLWWTSTTQDGVTNQARSAGVALDCTSSGAKRLHGHSLKRIPLVLSQYLDINSPMVQLKDKLQHCSTTLLQCKLQEN